MLVKFDRKWKLKMITSVSAAEAPCEFFGYPPKHHRQWHESWGNGHNLLISDEPNTPKKMSLLTMLFKRVQNEGAQIKRHPDFNALKSYLGIMRLMLYRGMPICMRAPIQVSGSLNPRDPVSLSPWVHGSLGLKSPKPPRFPRSSPQLPFFALRPPI